MKRIIAVIMLLALAVSGTAAAHARKKHHKHPAGTQPHGGGYYGGKYHGHKQGAPKKKLLRWDGFNNPIKGMEESAHKPPDKYPSQSTDK